MGLNIFAGNEQNGIKMCVCVGQVTVTDIEAYGLEACE